MRASSWLRLLALSLLLCWGSAARSEDAAGQKHMLWKAISGKSTVYLLGTIHVAGADLYPLAPVIEDAFNRSDILVEEINPNDTVDQKDVSKYVQANGTYPLGDFLQNHLSEDTRTQLRQYVAANKLDANTIIHLKPWLASVMIIQAAAEKLGLDKEKGLDRHFMQEAVKTRKPVTALESADYQLKLFTSFPDTLQDQLLLMTLVDPEANREKFGELFSIWKAGDADALAKLLTEPVRQFPALKPVLTRLIDDRNDDMTQKIEAFLKMPKSYFVAVGAGHLVGERGIVSQLRAKNYKVEQL